MIKPLSEMSRSELVDACTKEQQRSAELAAHIERLHSAVLKPFFANVKSADALSEAQRIALNESPKRSFSRRDALMKADAMHEAICVLESEFDPCHPLIERLEAKEAEYRRQAEEQFND